MQRVLRGLLAFALRVRRIGGLSADPRLLERTRAVACAIA